MKSTTIVMIVSYVPLILHSGRSISPVHPRTGGRKLANCFRTNVPFFSGTWIKKHALEMLKGHVGYVIGGLRITLSKKKLKPAQEATLKRSITYFENHKHMMRYDLYLAAGYPVATGIVEGTCGSLIKDRADKSGSRWSSIGVQAVLNERAIMKNGDWESFWKYHMDTEKERLYGRFSITPFKNKANQN